LTLVEDTLVLRPACLRGKVRLGSRTTNDSESGVRTFSSELVADQGIEPPSGDGVLFESLEFEKLDKVFDRGPEISSNAQLL